MKKLLYLSFALATLLTAASCVKELEGNKAVAEGTADITLSVSLGPNTKAFADGTKVDKLYAGLYEIGDGPTYTHVTHTAEAIAIDAMKATVTFNGKIHRGNSYRMVLWAQKQGAPYSIDWATAATTGPTVTVTTYTGNGNLANDDTRDAFYGIYDAENVQGDVVVTEQNAVQLKRPFAQVNVLVPNGNVDAFTSAVSTMTVAQAPTVLNLATKATSAPQDWSFSSAVIAETAFDSYVSSHKYFAMNYVLVTQEVAGAGYNVGFTVTTKDGAAGAGNDVQASGEKAVANVPLKPNGRTNIVGNVFSDDFNISVPIVVTPGTGSEQELTTVTVAVGGMDEANAISLTDAYNSGSHLDIDVAVNHPVTLDSDKPEITVTPASVATAEWVLGTGLRVTPLVENGKAIITLVFPAVTKTEYAAATAQIYIKVGNGQNTVATPTFDPAAGEVAQGTQVTITSTTEGASIYYTTNGDEPTNASTLYEDPVVINSACTLKAIAIKDGFNNSAVASSAYTIAALPQVATPTFSPAAGEYDSAQNVTIACTTDGATIHYTTDGTTPTSSSATYSAAIEVSATTTIKAIAVKDGMTDSEVATAAYTITLPPAQVATPTFSPAAGEYDSAQNVTIACTTDGATIHYTTDGTTPTSSSATYSAAIEVSATTTIKAIAVKGGMTDSEVATATFTINAAPTLFKTFTAASIGSGYGVHTGVSSDGMSWTVTYGQGTYIGTNSSNKENCKLGDTYAKVGTPCGYDGTTTQVTAIISESTLADIVQVVVDSDTDSHNPQSVSLVYSTNNTTYSLVETQDYSKNNGNTFTFAKKSAGYYAVVLYYTGNDYLRTNGIKVKFYQ